jgi:lipoprotein NlpI
MKLAIENHEVSYEKSSTDSTTTYRWHYAAPTPLTEDTSVLSPFDRSPRFLASSYPDYNAFARAYAAVLLPKETITPAIQAKAEAITAGVTDRRQQAQKIYEWVSRHIRYLAVEIGTGAIVPHDADTILANGYGDCKDHVALFSALLKAKGIPSELVLIDSENSYTLPDTAVIGAFDHAITWLPEFNLYADTTAGVAPFGTLPFHEYGKPVVRITTTGSALAKTPILEDGVADVATKTTATIDNEGHITGQTVTTATGPFSTSVRQVALAIQSAGPEQAAASALQSDRMPGSGSFITPPPEELAPSYTMTATFSIGPVPDLMEGRRFEMPTPLPVASTPGDFLMGPLFNTKIKDTDPTPCFSGREQEDITVTAPKGHRFQVAPPDTTIKTANLTFIARWTMSGDDTLSLHREFTSHVDTALCSGEVRKETAKQILEIRKSFLYGGAITTELMPQQSKVISLLQAARNAEKNGDHDEAVKQFTAVIAAGTSPSDMPGVAVAYLGRGAIYTAQKKYDAAIDDFGAAVKINPSLAKAYTPLAQMLADRRELVYAEKIWGLAIGAGTPTAETYYNRGLIRDDLGRHAEAQADFGKAIAMGDTPKSVAGYYADRGSSHWSAHELTAALKDYNESIARYDGAAQAFEGRALVEYTNGSLEAAQADFARAATMEPKNLYHALWLYIADARLGKDAKGELLRRTDGADFSAWPGPVVKVLRGDSSADQIVLPPHRETWQTERDVCEKDFYLAEMALANGDKAKAIALFHDTIATNITEYLEYTAAGYELERLSH